MRATFRLAVFLGSLGLFVGGCTPATSQSPSVQQSAIPSEEVTGLPPGCEPIDLRDADGERIMLDGRWTEVGTEGREPTTWWIRTYGDCVWGAGQIENIRPEGEVGSRPDDVQTLSGRIGSDFVITGEILWLAPIPVNAPSSPGRHATLRMLIEFDDAGEIFLREDREPGVRGPHCPDPVSFCPPPLLLQLAD